ncbi:MAG: threonine synthase [Endomicrobiia bacterium]|nr:threonine synthase [Endomicrobiia bacterium]
MKKIIGYKCLDCGKEIEYEPIRYLCDCGGNLDVIYDSAAIKKTLTRRSLESNLRFDHWRYLDVLPLQNLDKIPNLQVGWTPVYETRRLAVAVGIKNVFIKDDSRNPSASFKDRASSVVLAYARENGVEKIVAASTGNAGAALACVAASVVFPCVILVPKTAPKAKIAQLMNFGARVVAVDGAYDDAYDLSIKATEKFGWYNRNTGYNPITREGKKTCGHEICEQFSWEPPDYVFVSVGDGNIISGIWKGFKDMKALGLIEKLPKMVAVQSEKSNAVSLAYAAAMKNPSSKIEVKPVRATTIADSISVDMPRDGVAAVRALLESGGFAVEVSDDEIIAAIALTSKTSGVFPEPAAAAAVAGLKKIASRIKDNETALCVITGSGLKDVAAASKSVGEPPVIRPSLEALCEVLAL